MAGKRIDDSEIKQYRREGFLKFDLVEMLGAGAFAGLCAAFADAEPRALRPETPTDRCSAWRGCALSTKRSMRWCGRRSWVNWPRGWPGLNTCGSGSMGHS